jgi:phospholipase/carboxylesterase
MSHRRQSFQTVYQPPVQPRFDIESRLFHNSAEDTVHSLFAPLHYEPGYPYPLLVWLHGPGSDERQLMRIMPLVSMRNYVAIAPRGTLLSHASQSGGDQFGWSQADEHVQQAEQRIFDSIELARQKFNVAPRRVFLAGFDAGGTMAFRVAMNHPYQFAGVLSLGGAFPTGRAPLANLPEARQLAVFLATGRHSLSYGEVAVCADLRLLHTAGVSITLRLYPCGHEISQQMLADVDRWIIEQITATARTEAD